MEFSTYLVFLLINAQGSVQESEHCCAKQRFGPRVTSSGRKIFDQLDRSDRGRGLSVPTGGYRGTVAVGETNFLPEIATIGYTWLQRATGIRRALVAGQPLSEASTQYLREYEKAK